MLTNYLMNQSANESMNHYISICVLNTSVTLSMNVEVISSTIYIYNCHAYE